MKWKTIDEILKKFSIKIWLEILLQNLTNIFLLGNIITLGIIIALHIKPMVYIKNKIFYMCIILITIAVIITFIKKPSLKYIAKCGDQLGLEEKLLTYIELKDNNEIKDVFDVFKDDLEDELQDFQLIKKYKINIKTKRILIGFLLMIVCFGGYFIPSFSKDTALEMESINKEIKNEVANLNIHKDEVLKQFKDEKDKKEANKIFEKLEKNLNKTYEYNKAYEEMCKSEEKLNHIKTFMEKRNMKFVSSLLKGTSLQGSKLDLDLQNGTMKDDRFNDKNSDLSFNDIKKIKDNLNKSKGVNNNTYMKDQIAKTLKQDNPNTKSLMNSVKNKEDEIKLQSQFNNSKNKLMAKKSQKDFETGNGDKKSNSFSLGKKETSYKYGEKSNNKNSGEKLKGNGDTRKEDNNSTGSSKTGINKEVKEKANTGTIKKGDISTNLDNSTYSINVNSKINKQGNLFNKNIEEVKGQHGQNKHMENKWLQYKNEGMNYILKYHVPMDKEHMVINYFEQLNSRGN